MRPLFVLVLSLLVASPLTAQTTQPANPISHVLIISVDGARPDLILRADTPNIHRLMESGSYTMWARTIASSNTLPSHVSMLTGVPPEVHGITWNGDLPLAERVYPARPTIFELARKRGLSTALATGKSKFNIFDKPGTIDWKYISQTPTSEDPQVTPNAIRILSEHKPNLMVVHFPTNDNVGHAKGWGSPEQMAALAQADTQVGAVLEAIKASGMSDSTAVILTADHGGAGRTHGPEDPRSRTIPWIIAGPGIRRNFDLTRIADLNVETTDTFATACALLNIPVERRISGKFVSQILSDGELLKSTAPATQP